MIIVSLLNAVVWPIDSSDWVPDTRYLPPGLCIEKPGHTLMLEFSGVAPALLAWGSAVTSSRLVQPQQQITKHAKKIRW